MTHFDTPTSPRDHISMPRNADNSFALWTLTVWIWLCAGLNVAGWGLSAIGELNATGYLAVLLFVLAAFLAWRHIKKPELNWSIQLRKWLNRIKKPFPFAFFVLSVMAFWGGAIYAPTNYDGLAYRLPRVLHWLAAGHWEWIHTDFPRLNNRACGIEWLSAPLIAIFKTDRVLFLINFVSFLFLPGLTYGVLSRLGVRRRVAWHWMWIAPTGYCFLLQAGSIGNDALSAPFALAAIFFALRARESGRVCDLFTSTLSAALMTAVKASNLPLLLPWAIAMLPSLRILIRRPVATVGACLFACFASFLPTAIANQYYGHDWSGLSLEADKAHGHLPIRLVVNTIYIAFGNLTPPVFPEADQWNSFEQRKIPPKLMKRLQENFTEPGAPELYAAQLQMEESAGFGFGPTILIVTSAMAAAAACRRNFFRFDFQSLNGLSDAGVVVTAWIAAFALLSQSEVAAIARIMTPYYILLLPLLLRTSCHEQIVKKIRWRVAALFIFVFAAGLLIISPARPLFPAGALLEKLQALHSDSRLAARVQEVYRVYHDRDHAFAPALAVLPPDLKVLGMVTYDDPEAALWQPYGSRQIVCVKPADTPAWLKAHGVRYILARSTLFGDRFPDFNDWKSRMNATVTRQINLNIRAGTGPVTWYLLQLN
jgi:hypothetical protein